MSVTVEQKPTYSKPAYASPPQSLRHRFLFFLGGLLLVALLLMGMGVLYFVFQTEQRMWQVRQQENADKAAETVSTFLQDAMESLVFISLLDRDYLASHSQVMMDVLEKNPALLEMIRLDMNGSVLVGAYQDASVLANLFTIPQSGWFLDARSGQTHLGSLQVSVTGEPYLIVAIPTPQKGVVAARLRMNLLRDVVSRIRVGGAGQAYVIEQEGQIIVHPDPTVTLEGASLAGRPELAALLEAPAEGWLGEYTNFQEIPVVGAMVAIPGTDWVIVTELPREEAYAATWRAFQLFALGVIIFELLLVAVMMRLLGVMIFRPLDRLRTGTERMGQGELGYRIVMDREDEMGQLAAAFNRMAGELQDFYGSLEQKVADRTRHLETIATFGEYLGTATDPDEVLAKLVRRISESFNYYHTHAYILDDERKNLVVVEGSSRVGAEMKAAGYVIPLATPVSLVARAARTGQIVKVDDVSEAEDWLPNPLLPDTRSEVAIPIVLDEQVIGVLDIQADRVAGLDESAMNLFRSLVNQAAVALNNTRLFYETQAALAEVEALNRRLTREAWEGIRDQAGMTGYVFTRSGAAPVAVEWLPAMAEAVRQKNLAYGNGNGQVPADPHTSLAIPLTLRGELIGVIGIERPAPAGHEIDDSWSDDELVTIQAVSEQIALALDAARLAGETERAAWRDRMVSEATARVWLAAELEEVMKAAVTQLGEKLGASEVVIRLGTEGDLISTGVPALEAQ